MASRVAGDPAPSGPGVGPGVGPEAAGRGSLDSAGAMVGTATPTFDQLEAVRRQQLELATLHAQMEPILAMTFPAVDNEEATSQLFERNAAQFAARERALTELMVGGAGRADRGALQLTQLAKDSGKLFADGERRPASKDDAR